MGLFDPVDILSRSSNKNPFSNESFVDDVSEELPSRASNPLIRDSEFQREDQEMEVPVLITASTTNAPAYLVK